MYAVMGTWQMDHGLRERQLSILQDHIVPGVRQAPGIVKGYWSEDSGTDRSYTFIVFDTRQAADSFASSVRGNSEAQGQSGVAMVDLAILEITAET